VKIIYKYHIQSIPGNQKIRLPAGSKLLHIGDQLNILTLWWLVDIEKEYAIIDLEVFGTGQLIPDKRKYLATVQMAYSGLVLHVFLVED